MSDRPPLRLIPSPRLPGGTRDAADAATVEAVLDGLPPGGRVRIVGPGAWLAEALASLDAEVLDAEMVAAGVPADVVAFPMTVPGDDDGGRDGGRAADALADAAAGLDAGGRVVVEAVHPAGLRPYQDGPLDADGAAVFVRTLASWVRVLAAAGLVVRSIREPLDAQTGAPVGLVLVAEPAA